MWSPREVEVEVVEWETAGASGRVSRRWRASNRSRRRLSSPYKNDIVCMGGGRITL